MKVQIEQIGVDEGFLGKSVTKGDGFNIGIRKNKKQRKGLVIHVSGLKTADILTFHVTFRSFVLNY